MIPIPTIRTVDVPSVPDDDLLPGFDPTTLDLARCALAQPLDVKIKNAIAFLQLHSPRSLLLSPSGFHLGDSYGKDSCVCLALLKMAKVPFLATYSNTTIDPPELLRFGRKFHPDTVWHNTGKHLVLQRMVEKRNPPTRCARWCCSEYKESLGDGLYKVLGVRIAESTRRAGLWKLLNVNKKGGFILAPIAYWTDMDIWTFINEFKIPYSSLYDEGFSRLGCIGCPLAGPRGQERAFARWPSYKDLWYKGFKALWDVGHNEPNQKGEPRFFVKYGSALNFINWWLSGGAFKGESPQCIMDEIMENT